MSDTLDTRYDVDQIDPATDSAGHQMIEPGNDRKSGRNSDTAPTTMQRLPQYVRHG